jgi:hypothetical protein
MKDAHLSLRLPQSVAKGLEGQAEARGISRSMLVREVIASYLGGSEVAPAPPMTARSLARRWRSTPLPVLDEEERSAFAEDLPRARQTQTLPIDPWG